MKKLVLALLFPWLLTASAAERTVTFRLVLTGESVSETLLNESGGTSAKSVDSPAAIGHRRHLQILSDQRALEAELSKRGLQRINRTTVLLNSITVQAPESRRAELAALPGVKAVYRVNQYRRSLVKSAPFVGAPAVWNNGLGFTGKGVRIGIIDSGIDYTHADFGGPGTAAAYTGNDPTTIEPGTFPTSKVAGGTDLAGDDYDASGANGSTVPSPDPDPLDGPGGHGTHVAGIAAGTGVLATGKTFTGSYGTNIYTSNFLVGPGVAPEAKLYAIKVFGRQGSTDLVLDGLEWAADPNQDGSTSGHMDVVNLSLGSPFGDPESNGSDEAAIKRLAGLGCTVVVAAGNDGNTPYIISWPAVSPEAIAVANILDDGVSFSTTKITAPAAAAGNYVSVEAVFTPKLAQISPVSAAVIYIDPHDACGALVNATALSGKIALIDRGTCFFSDKVRTAQNAGAVGVIVVNNVPGSPIQMAGSGSTSDIRIPAVMISQSDGDLLKAQLGNGLAATLANSPLVVHPEFADTVESSSSRGPVLQSTKLKPDLSAPGDSISSANGGSGSGAISYSGTSMATPHVAGAAALLKQAHPAWSAADIKAALMNSAVPSHDQQGRLYGESRTGAGRLNALAASTATALLRDSAAPGEVSLSFGAYELLTSTTVHKTVRIDSRSALPAIFALSVSNTLADPGVILTLNTNLITVGPGGSATLDAALTITPALLHPQSDPSLAGAAAGYPIQVMPEASGEIYANDGVHLYHVPWHVTARALSSYAASVQALGSPAGDSIVVPIPTTGTSAHPHPLVSVFQYGATSPNQQTAFPDSGADILAVGAATDFSSAATFADARVFFGIAMAGKWTTPQRANIDIDIEIDLNGDGQADYTISNSSQGNLGADTLESPSDANAALMSVVYSGDGSSGLAAGSTWNVLAPEIRDTAPYHNGAAVQSVKATDIGLTDTSTQFRYRASTLSPLSVGDSTEWVSFDVAHPLVDSTLFGIESSPFFDEGRPVRTQINRTNAASGVNLVKVLLIHQNNTLGQQSESVTVHLETSDIDNNKLPDAWELKYFGKLGNSPTADSDGDGVSNANEAAAGTDPTDPASVFRIVSVGPAQTAPALSIRWIGAAGYQYNLERTSSLSQGFNVIHSGIAGIDGTNSVNDPAPPTSGPVFYRVRVQ